MRQLELFYNTTNLEEEELLLCRQKAKSQDEIILKFFSENPDLVLTPFEVQHMAGLKTKERLAKYHGVSKEYFPFYLKELEFRYNNRTKNIFKLITQNIVNFVPDLL